MKIFCEKNNPGLKKKKERKRKFPLAPMGALLPGLRMLDPLLRVGILTRLIISRGPN